MSDTFTCDHCGGTFPDEPEDEAAATEELERDYPGLDKSACAEICDDCYKNFNAWRATKVEYTPPPIPEWARAAHEEFMRRVEHRLLYGDSDPDNPPRGLLP